MTPVLGQTVLLSVVFSELTKKVTNSKRTIDTKSLAEATGFEQCLEIAIKTGFHSTLFWSTPPTMTPTLIDRWPDRIRKSLRLRRYQQFPAYFVLPMKMPSLRVRIFVKIFEQFFSLS